MRNFRIPQRFRYSYFPTIFRKHSFRFQLTPYLNRITDIKAHSLTHFWQFSWDKSEFDDTSSCEFWVTFTIRQAATCKHLTIPDDQNKFDNKRAMRCIHFNYCEHVSFETHSFNVVVTRRCSTFFSLWSNLSLLKYFWSCSRQLRVISPACHNRFYFPKWTPRLQITL